MKSINLFTIILSTELSLLGWDADYQLICFLERGGFCYLSLFLSLVFHKNCKCSLITKLGNLYITNYAVKKHNMYMCACVPINECACVPINVYAWIQMHMLVNLSISGYISLAFATCWEFYTVSKHLALFCIIGPFDSWC